MLAQGFMKDDKVNSANPSLLMININDSIFHIPFGMFLAPVHVNKILLLNSICFGIKYSTSITDLPTYQVD